jgi:glycosyltransferase involved in cell wall biosynthesis
MLTHHCIPKDKSKISMQQALFDSQEGKILSVATAGLYADQLADVDHLRYPRVDYLELQRLLKAESIDYSAYNKSYAGRHLRRLETHLRSDVYIALIGCWKGRNLPLVFTWSERAGIPFALYSKFIHSPTRFVTMFQCWSERQELAVTRFNLFPTMDHIIVHCTSMKENLVRLGAPGEKVSLVHYSIDQEFFSPSSHVERNQNMIMSIGEPRSRDYPSLFQAVDGLPITVTVAGFGHWYAREKNGSLRVPIPENVSMTSHLTQLELRRLYASAKFLVLPIQDLVYSAGATASLEAASMARAVVAFRSRGIADYIVDGETGILVEPGNVTAMRDAIRYLLANPGEAKRLGQNARQRVVEKFNLETYVSNIANVLVGREESGEPAIAGGNTVI